MHVILFMSKDIYATYKSARKGVFNDRHHVHMVEHYKEAPWWWYVILLVISFVLGLIVVLKGNITLSAWAYVVALVVGCVIAPFVSARHYNDGTSVTDFYRARSSTPGTVTVSRRTTCPRCSRV
jgi:uncharacterized membrane protein